MPRKRIAIIGTHSAGKTTLSYLLAVENQKKYKSCKIVQEVARSCPYPLNEGMSRAACLWIYHEQIKKELDAMQKFDTIICDRSALDSFIYAKAQNCFDDKDAVMNHCYSAAEEWMLTYDEIIYVKPGDIKPTDDGVRSMDIDFQKRVERIFDDWVVTRYNTHKIKLLMAEEIFNSKGLV